MLVKTRKSAINDCAHTSNGIMKYFIIVLHDFVVFLHVKYQLLYDSLSVNNTVLFMSGFTA
jgi:hypothetical protein